MTPVIQCIKSPVYCSFVPAMCLPTPGLIHNIHIVTIFKTNLVLFV